MITKVTILHTDLKDECGLAAGGVLSRKDLVRLESACARRLTASALSLFLGRDPSEDDLRTSAEKRERRKANRIFPLFLIFITAFPIPAVSSYARPGTGRSGSICK